MIKSLIEQHWLERTHWPRRIILAIALGFALALAFKAHGDEPKPDALAPPQASMSVMQCGRLVVAWILTKEGNMYRADQHNRPETEEMYKALLAWMDSGKKDVFILPCPTST